MHVPVKSFTVYPTVYRLMIMQRLLDSLIAMVGVIVGCLLWDRFFSDGIDGEDLYRAAMAAILSGFLQWWLSGRDRKK